jgi:hypothetical protein
LHPSFECGCSEAPLPLVIVGRISMENPTTWFYYRLNSPALDRTELMVGKVANSIRAVHFHSIRSSGSHRLSPTGRCRESRPALSQFVPSPTINSVRSIACELRRTSRQPSCQFRARRTPLCWFLPFVRKRELRRFVTPRHRMSVLHGNTN